MITDEEINEPKSAFNKRYGEWLREMRLELAMSQENVAAAAGIELAALCAAEDGVLLKSMMQCVYVNIFVLINKECGA